MAIELIEGFNKGSQIKVIGVGGGGGNAVDHMIAQGVGGVEFICANTDAQALNRSLASELVQLGLTGLGAGSRPDVGSQAAKEAEDRIRKTLAGTNMLFITAGMGGGTGTGAAPVIARLAKEMNILTVGVVTKPFSFEGARRSKQAEAGVAELEKNVDSLIVVLNDKLLEVLGDDALQDEAFAAANDVLKNAVGGISEIINMPGLINVDFEDVKTVMSEPGKAMMGTATASGPDRAVKAAEAAVRSPLLEGIDLSGARGVLVLFAAAKANLKLSEVRNAMTTIGRCASSEAHVIYGSAYDENLGDQLRVTVIATGLSGKPGQAAVTPPVATTVAASPAAVQAQIPAAAAGQPAAQPQVMPQVMPQVTPQALPQAMPQALARTGTDNLPLLNVPVASAGGQALGITGIGMAHDAISQPAPNVWKTARVHAQAKVEALSNNGMDELEIPAFLRKQAD